MNTKLFVLISVFMAFFGDYCAAQDEYYDINIEVNNDENVISAIINSDYNKLVRPNRQVDISLRMSLMQLVSLDEKNQIMTSSFYLACEWFDRRLIWDPKDKTYGNLTGVMVPSSSIWLPDLFVLNAASASGFVPISASNLAVVNASGFVYLVVSVSNMQTRCKINAFYFPFDNQNCSIVLGTWILDTTRINFFLNKKVNLDFYTEHPVWQLKTVNAYSKFNSERNLGFSLPIKFEDISFNISIKRGSTYYMLNLVLCFILNVLIMIAFFIPFANQIAVGMTSLLTFGVNALSITNFLPVQSLYVSLVSVYFILSMLCTFFALAWFSVQNYLITKGFIPKWLQKIAHLIQILLFCFCLKQKPKTDIAKKTIEVSGAPEEKNIVISCNKCEMCSKCQENQEKEKKKKQEKDKINEEIAIINYLILTIIFMAFLLLHTIVWISSITQ